MARLDQLLTAYRRHVGLPMRSNLPLSQRVWFLVYAPEDERRMANRIGEFELATREAESAWHRVDLSGSYADWLDTFDTNERDVCLAQPEIVENYADPGFRDFVCERIRQAMALIPESEAARTVLSVTGLMDLWDFTHVSAVVDELDQAFQGIVLVFFPGARDGNTYRFLDARTGWNYLAVPIIAER